MADELEMKPMDLLDIGGGFSMNAANGANNFDKAAPFIRQHISEVFPRSQYKHVQVIGEPGRLICQDALNVCTRIYLTRQLDDVRHYFVDSGVY